MTATRMIPSARSFTLHVAFPYGSTVYLKCRQERLPGMVTGFLVGPTGIVYRVAWGDACDSNHYDVELAAEFDPDFDVSP